MKRFLKLWISTAIFIAASVSCDRQGENITIAKDLILSVDKEVITAGGYDEALFTVKYGEEDVTAASLICVKDKICLSRPVFSSEEPGKNEFYATYRDGDNVITSKNRVFVTVVDDFDPSRELHKNTALFIWTATWCGPCYILKNSIRTVTHEEGGDHIAYVNFYTSEDSGDQQSEKAVQSPLTEKFLNQMALNGRFIPEGFPTTVIDFTKMIVGGIPVKGLRQELSAFTSNPARTGIKVNSRIEGGSIYVTVSIGAKEADTYYLGVLLTEDDVEAFQNGGGNSYLHTNVVRDAGMESVFGDNIGALSKGDVITKSYTFPLLPNYEPTNLNLMVYTLYDHEMGARVMANSVKAGANGFTDYQYEN